MGENAGAAVALVCGALGFLLGYYIAVSVLDTPHDRYCNYALKRTPTASDSIRFATDSGCVDYLRATQMEGR